MKYNPKIVVKYFQECGLPLPVTEYRFNPDRKWRFDFCWPTARRPVALECEGAIWTGGAHARGSGIVRDIEKYNSAVLMGFVVLRCQPKDLCTQETVDMVKKAMSV